MADTRIQIAGKSIKVIDQGDGSFAFALGATARSTMTAIIASGASLSGVVDLGDNVIVALSMPSAWTTAVLSFQSSYDGVTYQELKDEYDALLSYNPLVASNRAVEPQHFLGWRYIKVRSGTAAVPVNQTAERVITLITRPL